MDCSGFYFISFPLHFVFYFLNYVSFAEFSFGIGDLFFTGKVCWYRGYSYFIVIEFDAKSMALEPVLRQNRICPSSIPNKEVVDIEFAFQLYQIRTSSVPNFYIIDIKSFISSCIKIALFPLLITWKNKNWRCPHIVFNQIFLTLQILSTVTSSKFVLSSKSWYFSDTEFGFHL